jgi:hypothetical protein
LADRVRDNLLMDSGVAIVHGDPLLVRITLRARAAEFPGDGEQALFERARALAAPYLAPEGSLVVPLGPTASYRGGTRREITLAAPGE